MHMLIPLMFSLLMTPASAAGKHFSWTPDSADMLFTSGRDGNSEIYLLRAGQKEWTNLTQHASSDNWPVWSPDGRRIVFQSRREGNLDIFTMNADGSDQIRLTNDSEPDYLPAWSPDGKLIVFTSWRKEPAEEERAPHIYVMNADGTGQRRLVAESLETSAGATWSPDGARIVFSRGTGDKGADIFIAGADGNNQSRLTSDKDVYNGSPVFSPDGTLIAFYSDNGAGADLVVMKTDGTGRRTVLSGGQNWYPRWSPDGRWLIYTAAVADGDEGNIDIFAVPVAGDGGPILLAGGARREQEGSWRPHLTASAESKLPAAPDGPELTALLNTFLAGASRNDAAVHDRFWADDLIYTRSAGQRIGKAEILRDVRGAPAPAPGDPVTIYSADEIRVQQYGDAAIVAFRLVGTTTVGASTRVAHWLNTGTFLKRDGVWRAVGWQATKVSRTDEEVVREVTAVENLFQQATLAGDVGILGALMDDSFIWTLSTGEQMTRRQLLDHLGSGRLKYSSLETNKVTVTSYGEAAVVHGVSSRRRSAFPGSGGKGDPAPFTAAYTLTFVNRSGTWKVVAMHSSRPAGKENGI